jgi:hypothetical protein
MVRALPQRRRQLRQIDVGLGREPLDVLSIRARRALVGPDHRPCQRRRRRRVDLVDRRVPFAAFDAVDQRRQHALRPYRSFGPRNRGVSLFTLLSLAGTSGAALLWPGQSRLHLPALPSLGPAHAVRASRRACGPHGIGTVRAPTPRRLAHADEASLLAVLCRPGIPPPITPRGPVAVSSRRHHRPSHEGAKASPWTCRLATSHRRNGFVILRAARSPRAAPNPASLRRSGLRLHVS